MTEQSTIVVYPLDGTNRKFVVPYEYLARSFNKVTLLGDTRRELTLGTDYRFITANQIETTQAWGEAGEYTAIELKRTTPAAQRLVDFYDGSVLRSRDLNISAIQAIHIAAEAKDAAQYTLGENGDGDLDARLRKVVNLKRATEPTDAVPFGQLEGYSDIVALEEAREITEKYAEEAAFAIGEVRDLKDQTSSLTQTATEKATQSTEQAVRSENAADQAVSARDAAFVNADVYPDVVTGRAGVEVGEQFQVLSTDGFEYIRYRKDSGSAQTEMGRYPSARAVEGVDRLLPPNGKNLFNPDAVEYGFWYNNLGGVQFNSKYATTPKISVAGATSIAISGLPASRITQSYVLTFWSASGELIGRESGPSSSVYFPTRSYVADVPEGAATFTLNLMANAAPQRLQIEYGDTVSEYEPYASLSYGIVKGTMPDLLSDARSGKNLFNGQLAQRWRLNNLGLLLTSSDDDVTTAFVPVEFGKTYTVSGLNPDLTHPSFTRVIGFSSDQERGRVSELFPTYSAPVHTITISNPETRFIVVQVSWDTLGTYADAVKLNIQVEEGSEATSYDPYKPAIGVREARELARLDTEKLVADISGGGNIIGSGDWLEDIRNIQSFDRSDSVNTSFPLLTVKPIRRGPGPHGITNIVESDIGSNSNNLQFKFTAKRDASLSVFANILSTNGDGSTTLPAAKVVPFNVPSGQVDNPGTLRDYAKKYPLSNYTHPSVAYSSVGVAGYKYWMVTSFYPLINQGGAVWEDEDLFVSNDGESWMRVQSLYETDKDYTAPTLRLPPSDAATDARRHAFLPVFAVGDTLEISSPAHNGNPEVDRVTVTLGTATPFKHDPAILIDGGYVYVYHSFHLPYDGSGQGTHRFMVCVRTSDGVNWEAVRQDGSTMQLNTAEAVRQLFTKDGQGRYNYINYAYSTGRSNPEVIKYGEGDYELLYGYNFSHRFSGTTPYNFDFSNALPMSIDTGNSGNHPGSIYDGQKLYVVNNRGTHVSTDRGVSSTKLPHHPLWMGGLSGPQYKKAMCIGEGGKLFVFDTYRPDIPTADAQAEGASLAINRQHHQFCMIYPSLAAFESLAQNGLQEGYIDLQINKVNTSLSERECAVYNWIGNTSTPMNLNVNHQKVKITDLTVKSGDEVHLWVTLTAHNGGAIRFNGLQIESN